MQSKRCLTIAVNSKQNKKMTQLSSLAQNQTDWQWEDFKNTEEWNAKFPRKMISLFSEEGYGQYLESPIGSGQRYFIPAIPVMLEPITVVLGMTYHEGVEEVFYFDFLMPNGDKLGSRLFVERAGNFLKPVPIICGISPTQIRTALHMVVNELSSRL